MNTFLKETRRLLKYKENLFVILNNESCDLDSAVSCISLAYYYHKNRDLIPTNRRVKGILPLFNIKRSDYSLKTEVVHFFQKNSIEPENLIFKDEIDDDILIKNQIVLVDHHVSPFAPCVVAIFDHRPFDMASNLREECLKVIYPCGSCATLIADLFLKLNNSFDYKEQLTLLHGPIVLDTVNFSKEADKARDLDYKITDEIEAMLEITNIEEHRKTLFDELVNARGDISNLNSYQVLYKDMKEVLNSSGTIKVAFPGFPMLVQDYVKLENAEENIKKFAKEQKCSIVFLIGLKVKEDTIERDIGVIQFDNQELFDAALNAVQSADSTSLDLQEHSDCKFLGGKFFKQNNIKASRKQILPLVKDILNNL